MRRQIGWLMAATTSAVVLAFVIPLCLLVRTLAEDRGLAAADQEARNVAILVSGLHADPTLDRLVRAVDARTPNVTTSVLLPDGRVLGAPAPAMAATPAVARARAGEAFRVVDGTGARVYVPVLTEGGTSVVRSGISAAALHEGVTRAWSSIVVLGLVLLATAVLVAVRLGRRISTPVTDLATVAHRLREGDLEARAEPSGPPETVELGVALNRLAERVVELLSAERAAVGDLSHRLRTPITALRLDVESVEDPALRGRVEEHLENLQRTVDAIVKDARRPVRSTMTGRCDATRVVRERVAFWSVLAEDQDRRLTVDVPATPSFVAVEEPDLRDVVDILVDNVFAHTPEGVAFEVSLRPDTDGALLTVEDSGPGLRAPDAGHDDRVGTTGLGLQIVRRAVAAFGGRLTLGRSGGGGLRVDVWLPRTPAGPSPAGPSPAGPSPAGPSPAGPSPAGPGARPG